MQHKIRQPTKIRPSIMKIGTKIITHDVVISNCSLCAIKTSNVTSGARRNTATPSEIKKRPIENQRIS
jgi:hypothetical protein